MNDFVNVDKLKMAMETYKVLTGMVPNFQVIYRWSDGKLENRFILNFDHEDSWNEDGFEKIIERIEAKIESLKPGIRDAKEIKYEGFCVKIYEMKGGWEVFFKSDDHLFDIFIESKRILCHPYDSYFPYVEKYVQMYIESFLRGKE